MTYPTRKVVVAILVGTVLSLLAYFFLDQQLALFFKRPELMGLWLAARNITNIGLSGPYFAIAVVTFVFCKWVQPQQGRARIWARDFFFALMGSGILVHIFKFCVGRQRPHLSETFEPNVFHPFTTDWNFQSFASGHSQVMFTVATIMALAIPKWRWGFISVAVIIGLTRVIIHDHFLSDVIGGAVIGYVGALTSVYWIHRLNSTCLPAQNSP
jgi:membrane-associated phospholipid phosphatase